EETEIAHTRGKAPCRRQSRATAYGPAGRVFDAVKQKGRDEVVIEDERPLVQIAKVVAPADGFNDGQNDSRDSREAAAKNHRHGRFLVSMSGKIHQRCPGFRRPMESSAASS